LWFTGERVAKPLREGFPAHFSVARAEGAKVHENEAVEEGSDLLSCAEAQRIRLTLDERGRRRAAARAEWFASRDNPLDTHDILDT
jgi:hypothetical protein